MSEESAFPADYNLPALAVAIDPKAMRDILRAKLHSLDGTAYSIEDCHVERIRYRPDRRCTVQYILRLQDKASGGYRSLWVSGLIYPENRAWRTFKKLRSTVEPPSGTNWRTFEPICHLPELGMLLQVFPFDRRLPSLTQVMTRLPSELTTALVEAHGPGQGQVEGIRFEPVRYRAGLGAALHGTARVRNGSAGRKQERHFYAKLYRDERGQRIYRLLNELVGRRSNTAASFAVAKPIAYLTSLGVLLEEPVSGESLYKRLVRGDDVTDTMRQAAWALASFHYTDIPLMQAHSLADEHTSVARAAASLGRACPHLRPEIETIVSADVGVNHVELRPTHLDLKAEHILIRDDHLALLDFDACAMANPALDPALLAARLEGMTHLLPHRHASIHAATQVFVDEYFSQVPIAWYHGWRVFYAWACIRVAASFFQHQRPHWPDKVAAMTGVARASLDGEIW